MYKVQIFYVICVFDRKIQLLKLIRISDFSYEKLINVNSHFNIILTSKQRSVVLLIAHINFSQTYYEFSVEILGFLQLVGDNFLSSLLKNQSLIYDVANVFLALPTVRQSVGWPKKLNYNDKKKKTTTLRKSGSG